MSYQSGLCAFFALFFAAVVHGQSVRQQINREVAIKAIRSGCRQGPRRNTLKSLDAVCDCIAANEGSELQFDELAHLANTYEPTTKIEAPAIPNPDVLEDLDRDIANKCLQNPKYRWHRGGA